MEAAFSFESLVFVCLTYYITVYVSLIIVVTFSEISPFTRVFLEDIFLYRINLSKIKTSLGRSKD
jgi:hypothetical protein